jgi:protoheme ferro-lyase
MNTGVLLINPGTPDAPTPDAVGRYLREFLMDLSDQSAGAAALVSREPAHCAAPQNNPRKVEA